MIKTNLFDILIVYSDRIASSASLDFVDQPFRKNSKSESYNEVYSYFLKTCKNKNIKCAFTTTGDIVESGKCKSFWKYKSGNWIKVNEFGYSKLIFDKFSPISKRISDKRDLLFSGKDIKSFNSPHLFKLFFDKYKTFKKLKRYCIPAVIVENNNKESIAVAMTKLQKIEKIHTNNHDFANELVMKDRYGAGGRSVYKFNRENLSGMVSIIEKSSKSFVFQPLIKFDNGFRYNNIFSPTDIRFVYLAGKIFQTYIRIAKKGDFRCNEHRGGKLIYIPLAMIPKKITLLSRKIAKILGNNKSLYSLDFIVSNNNNIYLLEGNTGPGLDWDLSNKVNEKEAKKLIRAIVNELIVRSRTNFYPKRPDKNYENFPVIEPVTSLPTFIHT